MSKGKSYNRIVFLTTLSVYLGLVLVGATPQVLTYAALTRNFDIQNEIEVKDDLDNKPDNGEIEGASKDDFPSLFAELLSEIYGNAERGEIALPIQTNFRFEGHFNYSPMCSTSAVGVDSSDRHLTKIVSDNFRQKFEPKLRLLADVPNETTKRAKLSLQANSTDLSLKISFGKSKAEQFAEFLNQEFASSAISTENTFLKQVYENTKASSENNQVFIVTRLPRGSIDSLLAVND